MDSFCWSNFPRFAHYWGPILKTPAGGGTEVLGARLQRRAAFFGGGLGFRQPFRHRDRHGSPEALVKFQAQRPAKPRRARQVNRRAENAIARGLRNRYTPPTFYA